MRYSGKLQRNPRLNSIDIMAVVFISDSIKHVMETPTGPEPLSRQRKANLFMNFFPSTNHCFLWSKEAILHIDGYLHDMYIVFSILWFATERLDICVTEKIKK